MLGNLYREADQHRQAVTHYRLALDTQPIFVDAWINLGLAFRELSQLDDEMECYRRAATLDPKNLLASYNLGNALQLVGRYAEAIASYQRVLAVNSQEVNALFNMANAHLACGQVVQSIVCYERVAKIQPGHAPAFANLGVALRRVGRTTEALSKLECALRIDPTNVAALVTQGNVLADVGEFAAATATLERAIELDPANADALFNLGNIHYRNKQFSPALDALKQAVELKPHAAQYLGSLAGVQRALWDIAAADLSWSRLMANWGDGVSIPIDVVLEGTDDPVIQRQCATSLATDLESKLATVTTQAATACSSVGRDRYRIAYLSPDFGEHPVGVSLVEVLERHDRSRFEVIGLSLQTHPESAVRNRIVAACEQFHDISKLDIVQSIQFARDLDLDLVVDLAGYTLDSRPAMLAARVAPVQVSYLGFAGTMGATWLDYLIADSYVIPEASLGAYVEKIIRMNDGFFPTDATLALSDAAESSRASEGLPDDGFVFCCFNNAKRISKEVMEAWFEVLREVDNSVIWLQRTNLTAAANMQALAVEHGIDPVRLVFARFAPSRAEHLARHRLADLYLDTFPYNSHSTARDALYAGLPVLTLSGRSYASRVAGSFLAALQLPQLITTDIAQYKQRAIELARSQAVAEMKATLAEQLRKVAPFDSVRLARNLELTFAAVVERARKNSPTTNLAVASNGIQWH
jgi:predicted O-linked N-acetylglucosamine transferase (SPINDLY family)